MKRKSLKRKSLKRKSLKRKSRKRKSKCRSFLSKKIGINIGEYKSGRYKSISQAIAVSYSQVSKKYPRCKRYLKKKNV